MRILLATIFLGCAITPCYGQASAGAFNNAIQTMQQMQSQQQATQQAADAQRQSMDRERAQDTMSAQKRDDAARQKVANPFSTPSPVSPTPNATPFGASNAALSPPNTDSLAVAPMPAPTAAAPKVYNTNGHYQLIISSDVDCTVKVDDNAAVTLATDEPLVLKISPGDHIVSATSRDGRDKWRTVVDVDKPSKAVIIPLAAAKQARERGVQTAVLQLTQAQQAARTTADQAKQQAVAQASAAAARDSKKQQLADIQAQITDLRELAVANEEAAQNFEQQAQIAEHSCVGVPAGTRCASLNSSAAGMDRVMANGKRQENMRINLQISELQGQMQTIASQ